MTVIDTEQKNVQLVCGSSCSKFDVARFKSSFASEPRPSAEDRLEAVSRFVYDAFGVKEVVLHHSAHPNSPWPLSLTISPIDLMRWHGCDPLTDARSWRLYTKLCWEMYGKHDLNSLPLRCEPGSMNAWANLDGKQQKGGALIVREIGAQPTVHWRKCPDGSNAYILPGEQTRLHMLQLPKSNVVPAVIPADLISLMILRRAEPGFNEELWSVRFGMLGVLGTEWSTRTPFFKRWRGTLTLAAEFAEHSSFDELRASFLEFEERDGRMCLHCAAFV